MVEQQKRQTMHQLELIPVTGRTTEPADYIVWPADHQEQFWKLYPRRIAKLSAMKALKKARKRNVSWDHFIAAVEKYAAWCKTKEKQFIKHPATWLNGGCWDDEYDLRENDPSGRPIGSRRVSGLELEMEMSSER